MSHAISPELKAHLASGSTTMARCWRFERKDGAVITVTTCARDLLISGEIYRSKDGVNPASMEQSADASVANSDIVGALSDDLATERDIVGRLWDSAIVYVFDVNYRDLTMGRVDRGYGTIGDISVGRTTFKAEFRSLTQALQQQVGDIYQASCRATLGDAQCKVDVESMRVSGAITSVDSTVGRRVFTDTSRTEQAQWFTNGVIRWLTGNNTGLEEEIGDFALGVISLKLPMSNNVAVGDTYSIIPGCNKLLKVNQIRFGSATFPSTGFTIYDATRIEAANTYAGGSLTWTSGANNGTSQGIVSNSAGSLLLAVIPANAVVIGDGYLISPPTSALYLGDCKAKFNNVINFRGEPDVPGSDLILGLGGTTGQLA